MQTGKLVGALLIAGAFAGGLYLGQGDTGPVIASGGASYGGGYNQAEDAELTASASDTAVAVDTYNGVTHIVKPGGSIQEVVKIANPGDTIQVMPGEYSETIYIDKDSIRLVGVIEKGERATLNGKGTLNDAILYSGNNIVVENFLITKYKGNAIMGQAGNNFEIRNNVIIDTGVYGIFPQLGKNGIVEYNIISGIEDAAIYVGMSDNIHVAHNG